MTFDVPYIALFPPIAGGDVDWPDLRSTSGTWSEVSGSELTVTYRQSDEQPQVTTRLTKGHDDQGDYLALSISADKGTDFRFYRVTDENRVD